MWSKKNFNKTWKYNLYQLCSKSADDCFSVSSHIWQLLWQRAGEKLLKKHKNLCKVAEFQIYYQVDIEGLFHRTFAWTKSQFSHLLPTPGHFDRGTITFQKPWVVFVFGFWCLRGICSHTSVIVYFVLQVDLLCSFPHSTFIFGWLTYRVLSITGV